MSQTLSNKNISNCLVRNMVFLFINSLKLALALEVFVTKLSGQPLSCFITVYLLKNLQHICSKLTYIRYDFEITQICSGYRIVLYVANIVGPTMLDEKFEPISNLITSDQFNYITQHRVQKKPTSVSNNVG